MSNLNSSSFNPDNMCVPPGQPATLVEFPTGQDYATPGAHPAAQHPLVVFDAIMGTNYGDLITDLNRDIFNEFQQLKANSPALRDPITSSFEDIGLDIFPAGFQVPPQQGDTNINIGGNTFNLGNTIHRHQGNTRNQNQFLFPVEEGVRRAPIVPAEAMTDINGRVCGSNNPGVGMANFLHRLTVASFTADMETLFVNLRDEIHRAKRDNDWAGIQELSQDLSDRIHGGKGLQQDPNEDENDDTITAMVFNMSDVTVTAGTRLLCSPDANGQLWVVVASCGAC